MVYYGYCVVVVVLVVLIVILIPAFATWRAKMGSERWLGFVQPILPETLLRARASALWPQLVYSLFKKKKKAMCIIE